MGRIRDPTTGRRSNRWRRVVAQAAIATAFFAAIPSGARADEKAACVGESCSGTYAAVTTTGQATSSGGVAVSVTGSASGSKAGVSGTNWAYSPTAAVTGTGTSYTEAGAVGVSGTGRSTGGGENFSGEAYTLVTGLLLAPTNEEQAMVPTTDRFDPQNTAEKIQATVETAPYVALNIAQDAANGIPTTRSTPGSASASSSNPPPAKVIDQYYISQDQWFYCVVASTAMLLSSAAASHPHQRDIAGWLRTYHPRDNSEAERRRAGTPITNVPAVVNNIRTWGDRIVNGDVNEASSLMTVLTTDVHRYGHAMILSTDPAPLPRWYNRHTDHALLAHGYRHEKIPKVYIMDPYDMTRFGWTTQSWRGENPGGSWLLTLDQVWAANNGPGHEGRIVW